jgi:hemolysin III
VSVYGASLIGVFVVSALYHSVPWRPDVKAVWRQLDHSMIYLLVAGTYTPIAVVVLSGRLRVGTLVLVWGIAAFGWIQKWFIPTVGSWLSFTLQTTQGWIGLALLVPLLNVLPTSAVVLVVTGGVLYTIGLVVLVSRRPLMWPRVFSYHELMHVFVIAAAACHFAAIALYVSPHGALPPRPAGGRPSSCRPRVGVVRRRTGALALSQLA